jgi:hypothetical protein
MMVVTYKDGYKKLSKHNYSKSKAVDAAPYYKEAPHIRWKDREGQYMFAGFVLGIAKSMGINLISGADWDNDMDTHDQTFLDLPHFELT